MEFTTSADHRLKIKENEKIDKYWDFAINLKKKNLRKIRVMVILIVTGALRTVYKGLKKKKTGGTGLVWFYGISTIEGYLMQNTFLYI